MFQPQATPYSNVFSPYGIGLSDGNFQSYQPAGGGGSSGVAVGGGVVDSGGPTVFRETHFGPVAASNLRGGGPLNYNASSDNHNNVNNPQHYNNKMAEHDLQAQTRAAETYERENRIEVRALPSKDHETRTRLRRRQGPMVGEKRSSHAITEEYAKADPVYIAKTTVSIYICVCII